MTEEEVFTYNGYRSYYYGPYESDVPQGLTIGDNYEDVRYIESKTVPNGVFFSEAVLNEDFKHSDRWNDYEFYYPHFLAF